MNKLYGNQDYGYIYIIMHRKHNDIYKICFSTIAETDLEELEIVYEQRTEDKDMARFLIDRSVKKFRIKRRGDFLEISLEKAINIIQSANNKIKKVFSIKRKQLNEEDILIRIFRSIDDAISQHELLIKATDICNAKFSFKTEITVNDFEEKNNPGYLYVMSNRGFAKKIHKIGFSNNPTRRAKDLYKTGVPYEYSVMFQKWVLDMKRAESLAHEYLKEFRINADREFFLVSHTLAARIIDCVIDKVNRSYSEQIMFKERNLLQLFYKMDSFEKSELLQAATEVFSRQHSLDRHLHYYANKEEAIANLANCSLDEKIFSSMPSIEPWMYLDEYIYSAIENAWPEGISDVILGTSEYDKDNAQYLLDEVEAVAIREHFPVKPYFSIEDMLKFIRQWRTNLIDVVERKIKLCQTEDL